MKGTVKIDINDYNDLVGCKNAVRLLYNHIASADMKYLNSEWNDNHDLDYTEVSKIAREIIGYEDPEEIIEYQDKLKGENNADD